MIDVCICTVWSASVELGRNRDICFVDGFRLDLGVWVSESRVWNLGRMETTLLSTGFDLT